MRTEKTDFKTISDAIAAGYQTNPTKFYRGFKLSRTDISDCGSYGYKFRLEITNPDYLMPISWIERLGKRGFGESSTVWFADEKNRIGELGCFRVMFSRDTVESGFAAAIDLIDRYYVDNNDACAVEREQAAILAAAQAKLWCKTKQRAKKLAIKYGAENLSDEWKLVLEKFNDTINL